MQIPPGLINIPEHKPLSCSAQRWGQGAAGLQLCCERVCSVWPQEHHQHGAPFPWAASPGTNICWTTWVLSHPCREHQESITFPQTVALYNAQTCILLFPLLWRKMHHLVTEGSSFLGGMVHPQSPACSLKGDRFVKYADRWGNWGTKDGKTKDLQQGSGKAGIRCLLPVLCPAYSALILQKHCITCPSGVLAGRAVINCFYSPHAQPGTKWWVNNFTLEKDLRKKLFQSCMGWSLSFFKKKGWMIFVLFFFFFPPGKDVTEGQERFGEIIHFSTEAILMLPVSQQINGD